MGIRRLKRPPFSVKSARAKPSFDTRSLIRPKLDLLNSDDISGKET
jgi:hypothetical protein